MSPPSHRGAPSSAHSVLGLAPLLALADERGVPRARLLEGTGIRPAELEDHAARIPLANELRLVRNLIEAVPDPLLGVVAGRRYHLSFFGLLGSVVRVAPTAREAIRLFVEHLHLTYTPFAVHVLEEPEEATARIVFLDQHELGPARRFYLERDLSFTLSVAEQLVPDRFPAAVRSVAFDYDGGASADAIRRFLRVPVEFGREVAGLSFEHFLDRERPDGNALAQRMLEEHLHAFGRQTGEDDLVASARLEIAVVVGTRRQLPDEEAIAATLGVSSRTLRRHLDARGTSFRAIADEVLLAKARHHLRDSQLAVEAIAERLGYAEAASFIRAFRRWTGETPDRERARLRLGAGRAALSPGTPPRSGTSPSARGGARRRPRRSRPGRRSCPSRRSRPR